MKTDIEIAQEAEMMPIKNVAEQLGITMNTMKRSKTMKMEN